MKKQAIMDIEIYRDYFLVCFMEPIGGKNRSFVMHEDHPVVDRDGILAILSEFEIVTFNGIHFDIPLLSFALNGASVSDLKAMCDAIIVDGLKHWDLAKRLRFELLNCDHVDLKELCIGRSSLKIYGGRLHSQKMQDLPIPPDASIAPEQRELIRKYCINDLRVTRDLLNHLKPQIDLRREMSARYGVDLRSKSDAQISEAVIKAEVKRMTGKDIVRGKLSGAMSFQYDVPDFVRFSTPELKNLLENIRNAEFKVDSTGKITEPDALNSIVTIGNMGFRVGMGGLHSMEECCNYLETDTHIIRDFDVNSYYPQIIINQGMFPPQTGEVFKEVYKSIVDRRLEAKHSGDKVTADVLKITANGCFGKTNSIYSFMYAPKMMIQTTVTGQLSLLMMIEKMDSNGIPVISANTDGIVLHCPRELESKMLEIVNRWEKHTNFTTEETRYRALYNRDVNNYVAIKTDDTIKTKGCFASTSIGKNPQNYISVKAAIDFLKDGVPIEETIYGCDDIRQFITIRSIEGGGEKDGEIFTKNVRWYYKKGDTSPITYLSNGNAVATSTGGKACMDLPEVFPDDVDYEKYVRISKKLLINVGVLPKPEKLPRKNSKEWKVLRDNGDIIEVEGVWERRE